MDFRIRINLCPPLELSLRGLPLWYQLLVAVTPILTLVCLWLTNQCDPGIIPPSLNGEKGERNVMPRLFIWGLLVMGCG